jgi:colicin import membrane protein
MSEQKESSVLFSLKELMNLEEDRIKTEETSKAEAARRAEQERLDAERRQRDEEQARLAAEEEKRRVEDARAREEAARLEAIRQAEIERAKVEAERQAQLAAMSAQQQHERQLEALKSDEGKKKLRNTLIGVGVFVPLLAIGAGVMVYNSNQEKKAQIAAQQAEAAKLAEERAKLEARLKENEGKTANLQAMLENEKDEKKRLELQKQIDDAKNEAKQIGRGIGGPRPASGAAGPPKPCNCDPADPLCGC